MREMPEDYEATRRAVHAVAEHVLSPARFAETGRIGLRVVPGGIGTPPFDTTDGPREVAVVDGQLVVKDSEGLRRSAISDVGRAAAFAGVAPGAPADVYRPSTPLDPDGPLRIDPDPYQVLAGWFALVDESLRTLWDDLRDRDPSPIQLWPEHFDVAFTADGVTYGGSPGDDEHVQPYVYVLPEAPRAGAFWNEPFGASRSWSDVASVDDALAFYREGSSIL